MTTEQLLQEFDALPRPAQEAVARAIGERLGSGTHNGHSATPEPEDAEARRARRRAAAQRLHGILRGDGPPPTDEDIERMRDEYLMEKYG